MAHPLGKALDILIKIIIELFFFLGQVILIHLSFHIESLAR